MKSLLCTKLSWMFTVLLWSGSASSQLDKPEQDFLEARHLVRDRWDVESVRFQIVDGENISASKDGAISVGRNFFAQFTRDLPPDDANDVTKFALLHELVHYVQRHDIPDVPPSSHLRKPFECQADMLATSAYFDFIFGKKTSAELSTLAKSPIQRKIALKRISRQSPSDVLSNTLSGHINSRERVLAIEFGFTRSLQKWLTSSAPRSQLTDKVLSAASRIVGPGSAGNEFEWSMQICRAITRSHPDIVDGFFLSTKIGIGGVSTQTNPDGIMYQNFKFTLSNTEARVLSARLIALSGTYVENSPNDYAEYTLSDAAHVSVEVPPRSERLIEGQVRLPSDTPGSRSLFLWYLPIDTNSLISAHHVGQATAKPNCNSNWSKLGTSPTELMFAGLARLGAAARDDFKSIQGGLLIPGFPLGGYTASVSVPGAQHTRIIKNGSTPHAHVEIYDGEDANEAVKVYDELAAAFKMACATIGVKISAPAIGKNGFDRTMSVENLTGYSKLDLRLHSRNSQIEGQTKTTRYAVAWTVAPTE